MRKPKPIQRKAFKLYTKVLEKNGNPNMGEIMRICGYSPSYSENSILLTRSESWLEMEKKYEESLGEKNLTDLLERYNIHQKRIQDRRLIHWKEAMNKK